MRLLGIIALLFIGQFVSAQIKTIHLSERDIPKNMLYKGHVKDAMQYTDKEGTHVVIITESGLEKSTEVPGEIMGKAELYAYSYLTANTKLEWKLYDFTITCPGEVTAEYVPDTFAVTDLDNNSIAEVWLMYRVACRGDVSPSNTKIIMREGAKKFAMRGEGRVEPDGPGKGAIGGKYAFDDAFKSAPQIFRDYAKQVWQKNVDEIH